MTGSMRSDFISLNIIVTAIALSSALEKKYKENVISTPSVRLVENMTESMLLTKFSAYIELKYNWTTKKTLNLERVLSAV